MHVDEKNWFRVYYTGSWYMSGYDYPGEYQEEADKLAETTGLPTCIHIQENHHKVRDFKNEEGPGMEYRHLQSWKYIPNVYNSYAVLIRVGSIEDLLQLQRSVGYGLIIHADEIEIYDDYRE